MDQGGGKKIGPEPVRWREPLVPQRHGLAALALAVLPIGYLLYTLLR